ncbi:MAG: 3-deoxy-8-phosphooctulonate synthase [bacterium]|nr:MAG: 3-deoxy-8-phosphooctulonate synthase [bacterium]
MTTHKTGPVTAGSVSIGGGSDLVLIAGPCVIETPEHTLNIARRLQDICGRVGIPLIFKASYDKANRTSVQSFRGPGLEKGLEILASVRAATGIPVTSDVHDAHQASRAAQTLDMLQIPAFLCRQTDLLTAAAETGKPVNVKKGQFLAPWDVGGIMGKVRSGGGLVITERGTTFGYNNLVVDFRSFPIIRSLGLPVVYDATNSLQLPGGLGSSSGGLREYVPHLCRSAVACGVDGVFMEVHDDPDNAPCDGPNMWPLDSLEGLLRQLLTIRRVLEEEF